MVYRLFLLNNVMNSNIVSKKIIFRKLYQQRNPIQIYINYNLINFWISYYLYQKNKCVYLYIYSLYFKQSRCMHECRSHSFFGDTYMDTHVYPHTIYENARYTIGVFFLRLVFYFFPLSRI